MERRDTFHARQRGCFCLKAALDEIAASAITGFPGARAWTSCGLVGPGRGARGGVESSSHRLVRAMSCAADSIRPS